MAAQQPPVPNIANLNAAVNGMTAEGDNIAQNVRAYNAHQRALNVAQIHQQLAAIQANIQANTALISAQ